MKMGWTIIAAMLVFSGTHVAEGELPDKPNIVVVFTDDHGYADLACQEIVEDIRTPHIDALAADGVRMTSGYVTAPQCVPSRAGLLSGRYQNRFGVESNGMSLDGFNRQRTIAERLKEAGYATGMIGKWHLGPDEQIVSHGFDDVFYRDGVWANYDLDGKDVPAGTQFKGLYHIDANNAAARAFIKRHHDEPFFLYLAYRAPHVPLDATEKYLKRFPGPMPERRRKALAMISAVDDGVGGIVATLRECRLRQQTLIFLIGDNGAPLKIHKLDAPGGGPGWDGSLNDPLNGEKGMLSEGGIRVPFIACWPGTLPAGQVYPHPVISLDVAATAVAMAGLADDPALDGVNLIPYLQDVPRSPPRRPLFWRWIAQSAVREGRWKYLRGGRREYLFDLSVDKQEQHNLLERHPEVAARLRRQLQEWSSQLEPPGLQTRTMSAVWQQYYDYYLDGKPAPKPASQSPRGAGKRAPRVAGWLARNATLELTKESLRARPSRPSLRNARARPFLVAAGLELDGPLTAVVEFRASSDGDVGFAWREQGQRDFTADQVVTRACSPSESWQRCVLPLPVGGQVIHVRLLLPPGGADVRSVEFQDDQHRSLRKWQFPPGQ